VGLSGFEAGFVAARNALSSIGIRFDRPGRSIRRGLLLGVAMLALSVALYLALPKIGFHVGGILAVLVLGGVMTGYYVWRRDLLANVTAHFLVDMVLNVGLPLLGG
jgi:hypothetical protein